MPPTADGPSWRPNRRDPNWVPAPPDPRVREFHQQLDGYAPTPLIELPQLAAELGAARVFVKDESHRLGLPAFKALGASWAVHRALHGRADDGPDAGSGVLVTATDGNHGRAVARFAAHSGRDATVFVPDGVHPQAVAAIGAEGAHVVRVDGDYDDAVEAAATMAAETDAILVQDTAWDDYVEVPGWIVDGYATMFAEIDEQLVAAGDDAPNLVAIPTGVGSLLQAALQHYRGPGSAARPAVVSVEADTAACVFAGVTAGRPVTVATSDTVMAGLNCGTVSTLAWPAISAGLDAALLTTDAATIRAATDLADLGVDAGPCGAAPLAALRTVLGGPHADAFRDHVGLTPTSTVVLIVTEGTAANPLDLPA